MDWQALLKAYPQQQDLIHLQQKIREKTDSLIDDIAMPALKQPCSELKTFNIFAPLIAPVCIKTLKDLTGQDFALDMEGLLLSVFNQQTMNLPDGCDGEIIGLVIQHSIHSFLLRLREHNLQVIPETWNKGECPFCGSYRQIAFDAEDKRELHCMACGHVWRFARMSCPTCGNHDYNTMGYFEVEGFSDAKIYFCRLCTHYLKVFDTKTHIQQDPETADTLSLELDDIAVKEGFTQPS